MSLKHVVVLAIAGVALVPAGASAVPLAQHGVSAAAPMRFMPTGAYTFAPMGFVKLCLDHPDQCLYEQHTRSGVTLASADQIATLRAVNRDVNRSITPFIEHDPGNPVGETWRVAPRFGDCHDYAITKKDVLVKRGFAARSLRIAVAFTAEGVGHAVLVARTTEGDLVLDNRTDDLKNWSETDLRWHSIQSGNDPRIWFKIENI